MLIKCNDCPGEKFKSLPAMYWKPGGAVGYWLTQHGHIPDSYTFRCELCHASMTSGPAVAVSEGWDTMMLAQNDLGFYREHAHGVVLVQ